MKKGLKKFYNNINVIRSEMLSYISDYAKGCNYHPLIRYDKVEDLLYFKNYDDEWVDEYAADIWLTAEIADSVNARAILVDMAYIDEYSDYLEYDECNDSLILKLDNKEVGEDACPWALLTILYKLLFNN
jgi:hypothetical protein